MTTMPPEGGHVHPHSHDHDHEPQPVGVLESPPMLMPNNVEAVTAGVNSWLVNQILGAQVELAQAKGVNPEDQFVQILANVLPRLAAAESEVQVLRTQLSVALGQIQEMNAKLGDCGCHDEDLAPASGPSTTNGDGPQPA